MMMMMMVIIIIIRDYVKWVHCIGTIYLIYVPVIPRDAIPEPFGLKVCWKVSGFLYFFDNDLSDMKHF